MDRERRADRWTRRCCDLAVRVATVSAALCPALSSVGASVVAVLLALLSLGGSVHDPTDPVGRLLFNVLAMVAEFESDLIKMRTREGMKVARAEGRLRGTTQALGTPGGSPGGAARRLWGARSRTWVADQG
jgi:hypothetical protein